MSTPLARARERERTGVMREVSQIAIGLFDEHGYDDVTIQDVAGATGVSVATLYRRFGTKENLVCWQPDERGAMEALLSAVEAGSSILDAALDVARSLPDDAIEAIEATALARVRLIAANASLTATAREKAESFITEVLTASQAMDGRPLLERETEARCVAAAFDAGAHAWLRGEGSLRRCTLRALGLLRGILADPG
jgi:AcrR family transcriptional regulator